MMFSWWTAFVALALVLAGGGDAEAEVEVSEVSDVDEVGTSLKAKCVGAYEKFELEPASAKRRRAAVAACKRAGRTDAGVLVRLGRALGRDESTLVDATEALAEAVRLEPGRGEYLLDLARSYANRYSTTSEFALLETAVGLAEEAADMGTPGALCTIGQLFAEQGDVAEAVDKFEECLGGGQDDDKAREDDDDEHQGEESLRRAERSWMLYEYARLLEEVGHYKAAAERYGEAALRAPSRRLEGSSSDFFDHAGEALAGRAVSLKKATTSDDDEAVAATLKAYEEAIAHDGGANPPLVLSLGEALEEYRDDRDGAYVAARRCLWSYLGTNDFNENGVTVLAAAAELLADRGDVAVAGVAIDHAIYDIFPGIGWSQIDDDLKAKMNDLKRVLPAVERQATEDVLRSSAATTTTPAAAQGGDALYDALDEAFRETVDGHVLFKRLDATFADPASSLTWRAYTDRRDRKRRVMMGQEPEEERRRREDAPPPKRRRKRKKKRRKKTTKTSTTEEL